MCLPEQQRRRPAQSRGVEDGWRNHPHLVGTEVRVADPHIGAHAGGPAPNAADLPPPPEVSVLTVCCLLNRLKMNAADWDGSERVAGTTYYKARKMAPTGATMVQLMRGHKYLVVTPFNSPASPLIARRISGGSRISRGRSADRHGTRLQRREDFAGLHCAYPWSKFEEAMIEQHDRARSGAQSLCGLYEVLPVATDDDIDMRTIRRQFARGTGFLMALPVSSEGTSQPALPPCRCDVASTKALVLRHLLAEVMKRAINRIRYRHNIDAPLKSKLADDSMPVTTPMSTNWNFLDIVMSEAAEQVARPVTSVPTNDEQEYSLDELIETVSSCRQSLLRHLHLVPNLAAIAARSSDTIPMPRLTTADQVASFMASRDSFVVASTATRTPDMFPVEFTDEQYLAADLCLAMELELDRRVNTLQQELVQARSRLSLLRAINDMFRVMARTTTFSASRIVQQMFTPRPPPAETGNDSNHNTTAAGDADDDPEETTQPARTATTQPAAPQRRTATLSPHDTHTIQAELQQVNDHVTRLELTFKMLKASQKSLELFSQTFPALFDAEAGNDAMVDQTPIDLLRSRLELKQRQLPS